MGIATATLTIAGAMVSPQVVAQTQAERTAALEAQVNEMAAMMREMQAELSRVKAGSTDSTKVQELDQWMASVKSTPMNASTSTREHVFNVRGGWSHFNSHRGAHGVLNTVGDSGLGTDVLTSPVDDDAFYYGAGLDFNMNNDLFGLADGVSFGIELGIIYTELGEKKDSGLDNVVTTLAGAAPSPGLDVQQSVTVNMLRVSAAPKIKFMHGSKLRPWIIPVGIDLNIISPPSDAVTVLNTGMQFGAGVEYNLFRGIVAGLDGRYHWTPDDIDGVDTDGFTLGGSVGFHF